MLGTSVREPAYLFLTSKTQFISFNHNASNYTQIPDLTTFTVTSTTDLVNLIIFASKYLFTPVYQYFEPEPPLLSAEARLAFG